MQISQIIKASVLILYLLVYSPVLFHNVEEHYKLNPSDVARIQNGDFDFNVGELLTILNQLNRDVEICITPSGKKGGHIRVVAT